MSPSTTGIPTEALASAERMMTKVKKGQIRQHLLGDGSQVRHGTIENQSVEDYCNFLKTRLCYEVLSLEGKGDYE